MSLSNNAETLTLKWLLTTDAVTRPTAWYVALFTSDPAEAGSGTEVSGTGYARTAGTFSVTGDTAANTANIEFPVAGASWGTITHAAIFDASSGGNMIGYGALASAKTIASGDVLRVPTGQLTVQMD